MDYILKVEDLTKAYTDSRFKLDKVSFNIPYGTIMGFVGENGAGKTTTIGAILNTITKDSGKVELFGKAMTDKDTQIRQDIGVVFDAMNFSGVLTPKQVAKVMKNTYNEWNEELFIKLTEKLEIPTNKKIKTFSKGMSMKLAIIVALSHNPKLLILDEATSGLDPIVREEVLEVFMDFVQDEKHSILMSSHITSDLEKIADYITFIHQGKIVLTESKDALVYEYGIARCKAKQFQEIDLQDRLAYRKRDYQIDVLVQDRREFERKYNGVVVDSASIDDIMLLLVKGER